MRHLVSKRKTLFILLPFITVLLVYTSYNKVVKKAFAQVIGCNNAWALEKDASNNNIRFYYNCLLNSPAVVFTTAGNVGIGTTGPSRLLTVDPGSNNNAGLGLYIAGSEAVSLVTQSAAGFSYAGGEAGRAVMRSTGRNFLIGSTDANYLAFGTNNAERVRIDTSGNVGIGTTGPQVKLQVGGSPTTSNDSFYVNNNGNTTGGLYYGGNTNGLIIGNYAVAPWPGTNGLYVGGNTYLAAANGNVGIGIAAPIGKVDARDSSARQNLLVNSTNGNHSFLNASNNVHLGGNAYWDATAWNRFSTARGSAIVNAQGDSGIITFFTDAAGATPYSPTERARMSNSGGMMYRNWLQIRPPSDYPNAQGSYVGAGDFYAQGNVGFGGNFFAASGANRNNNSPNWDVTSDARLKTNIQPLSGALDKLLKLQGVSYQWKDPSKFSNGSGIKMGFVAQEVEKTFPQWVGKDKDGYKNLNMNGLEALTVEAIRDLKEQNETLKKEIDLLKQEVQKLKSAK